MHPAFVICTQAGWRSENRARRSNAAALLPKVYNITRPFADQLKIIQVSQELIEKPNF
jgi:hypothetical protein